MNNNSNIISDNFLFNREGLERLIKHYIAKPITHENMGSVHTEILSDLVNYGKKNGLNESIIFDGIDEKEKYEISTLTDTYLKNETSVRIAENIVNSLEISPEKFGEEYSIILKKN